jgi:hypothetical protein
MRTILLSNSLTFFLIFTAYSGRVYVPADTNSIQGGIYLAQPGDTVLVDEGTYYENINFRGKAITVASLFIMDGDTNHINNTTIDGSQPSHPDSGSVVSFVSGEDTTSILCGFTITGGTGLISSSGIAKIGGGIAGLNSGAKVINNYINNNEVIAGDLFTLGGGIAVGPAGNTSWVVVRNNVIRDNSNTNTNANGQANGGGIIITANTRVTENIIEYNTVKSIHQMAWGGGIFLSGDPALPLLQYCTNNKIRHNKALSPTGTFEDGALGGGLVVFSTSKAIIKYNEISYNEVESNVALNIDCYGAGVILQNQTEETIFAENYVAFNKAINNSFCRGAGIAIWHYDIPGSPRIIKNIIVHNTGGNQGGGFYIGGHVNNSAQLINNTIANNSAVQGGSVYIGWNNDHVSYPKIENSILWGNGSSIFINTGGVNVTYSNVEGGWSGTGNINADPLLFDSVMTMGDTTYCCLDILSPCIDAGNPAILCNDPEDPINPGFALWPAIGTLKNDMGAHGGITDSLLELLTGLFINDDNSNNLANKYELSQNYPNPFNPSTTIEFDLPKASNVTLKIYNILGEEVTTLVSDRLSAGSYNYEWDASNLASGVYLYRLSVGSLSGEAGEFVETRKMVLMR